MKWGNAFTPDYVNILNRAIRNHVHDLDYFICITDDTSGLDPLIHTLPLPELPLDRSFFSAGAWPKLSLFKRGILPKGYRTIFIDLDMIVCGDINRFFQLTDDFYAIGPTSWNAPSKQPKSFFYKKFKSIRNEKKNAKKNLIISSRGLDASNIQPNTLGSGMFVFDSDSLNYIYEEFMSDPISHQLLYDNEQHFLESRLAQWTPWPPGWIIHYKYSLRQPLFKDLFMHPSPPPEDTSVVAFSGRPRPHELAENFFSSLKEFPHCRIGKVDWVKKYWRENI